MYYFHLHFNLSPASSFLKESPQEIFQVPSQIFCVSNPITISLKDLGTLAECWKAASFLLTGFMVISSVSSTQQPSIFFSILLGNGIYGIKSVLPDYDKHCLGEITLCSSEACSLLRPTPLVVQFSCVLLQVFPQTQNVARPFLTKSHLQLLSCLGFKNPLFVSE